MLTILRSCADWLPEKEGLEQGKIRQLIKPFSASTDEDNLPGVAAGKSSHESSSFEIHAYDALLSTVKDLISIEYDVLKGHSRVLLDYFNGGAPVNGFVQNKIRLLKDKLSKLVSKVTNYRRSLQAIFEDDETMALMNLSSLSDDPSLYW